MAKEPGSGAPLTLYFHPLSSFCQKVLTALYEIDQEMATRTWAMGDTFTMADCAAAPALFYANQLMPLAGTCRHTARYLDRLMARPSFARVVKEAQPYFAMFPG